jgi:hypothetical protein
VNSLAARLKREVLRSKTFRASQQIRVVSDIDCAAMRGAASGAELLFLILKPAKCAGA